MKRLVLVTVLALVLALAAAGLAEYTPGTYEASAFGQNGQVPVKTTFTEDKIIRIEIGENVETPGVSDWPIALMPHRIITEQSLAVDTVSGATRTSNAILNAVKDCAQQAGGDVEALTAAPEKAPAADIEETADVIVVGGGGAGLAAAVAATDKGASVILIEKTGFLGGNSIVSGGIYNAADPELQGPLGIEDSPEFHAQQTWEGGDKVADYELVQTLCLKALDGFPWL